jgi:hypothetical protein
MPVADVLDLSELEVWAKIGELDRANLKEGQEAVLQLDAIPDKQFRGTIKSMSGTATADVFSGDPSKKFDVVFAIDMRQLLTGLGMKQEDVERIMATAAANAKKNINNTAGSFFSSLREGVPGQGAQPGQPGAPGLPGATGAQGQPGGDQPAAGEDAAPGGGRRARGGRGGEGGGQAGGGQGRGGDQAGASGGQGGRGGFANLSPEDRKKFDDLRTKLQAASGDDREKLM